MLAALPARRLLTVLPLAVFIYGCSDPATAPTPRIDAKPHTLLAPVVSVTNTDDAGAGSLRQAIIDAPAGTTIQFAAAIAGQTIVLSSGDLDVDKLLTIEGPLSSGITISGGLISRAFRVTTSGNLILRNVSLINGREEAGGAMIVEGTGIATLDHSLVANNETYQGPGGGIYVTQDAELVVVNSTISGNATPFRGGAILSTGKLSIRNSTIAFNVADNGGGVVAIEGSFNLRNSIIAFNVDDISAAESFPNCELSDIALAFTGRNISNDASCGTDPAMMLVATPLLDPLANNGGPTKTHALRLGPGVDYGLLCSEATDQRYVIRNQGFSCDLGAFEFNNYGTITIALNPNASVNAKTGVATVTGTIKCSATTSTALGVQISQTQKATGKFNTIIQAQGEAPILACGPNPSSWSVTLTPATGKFEPGSASSTVSTVTVPAQFLSSIVTGQLKLFQVK